MEGTVSACNLKSNYSYQKFVNVLNDTYGFEKLSEGGFGVILGVKQCVIKLIKDIKRCQELKNEILFYQIIEKNWNNQLFGRVPHFNLFHELNDYCHFNAERLYSPLLEYDDGVKVRVGYLLGDHFKFLKQKYLPIKVNKNLYVMPRRKLIHFYVNHYDLNLKYRDDQKGDLYGLNALKEAFGDHVKLFCFDVGQLLAFLILDCHILPFDIEVVVATTITDKTSRIYMFDFNECQLENYSLNLMIKEAARSLYSKDGKFYFPNKNHVYYQEFIAGWKDGRDDTSIIDAILNEYNQF